MSQICKLRLFVPRSTICAQMSQLGHLGSGAGRGGGGGGAIREAGGSFGRMEAAHEEEYFHKKKIEQLAQLKAEQNTTSKEFHESKIKELEAEINQHKEQLK